jgi:DNA-directed RNA polymerase specialized sigma24 family protein
MAVIALHQQWSLSKDAFDGLLARLSDNPNDAGRIYESIRAALITFFECRGSPCAADHADETINRVARRLAQGATIHTANPASYFYGVARNVLKEHWDTPACVTTTLDAAPASALTIADGETLDARERERISHEKQLTCLERCLNVLSAGDRSLVFDYYRGDGGAKIRNRRALADRLSLGPTALRLRALRIRQKLERCVVRCVEESPS